MTDWDAPLRFGDCRFDQAARELRRRGQLVSLSPRAFDLLALLLRQRPRALSHDQLHQAVWPETHVGYTSLAHLVAEVRKAIGDVAPRSRYLRSLPRFGYAFVGEVTEDTVAGLRPVVGTLVAGDREYALPEGETLVGRGAECGVRLPSSSVSRVHARIRADARRVRIEDARSKNGTRVNGHRCEGAIVLHDGDELLLGRCRLIFQSTAAGSTHTVARDSSRSRGHTP